MLVMGETVATTWRRSDWGSDVFSTQADRRPRSAKRRILGEVRIQAVPFGDIDKKVSKYFSWPVLKCEFLQLRPILALGQACLQIMITYVPELKYVDCVRRKRWVGAEHERGRVVVGTGLDSLKAGMVG